MRFNCPNIDDDVRRCTQYGTPGEGWNGLFVGDYDGIEMKKSGDGYGSGFGKVPI